MHCPQHPNYNATNAPGLHPETPGHHFWPHLGTEKIQMIVATPRGLRRPTEIRRTFDRNCGGKRDQKVASVLIKTQATLRVRTAAENGSKRSLQFRSKPKRLLGSELRRKTDPKSRFSFVQNPAGKRNRNRLRNRARVGPLHMNYVRSRTAAAPRIRNYLGKEPEVLYKNPPQFRP